ncbi:hypothetical protein [Xanthomonas sp. LMG 12459]|uniref:hypothetical protein n=1 Tax=Xanthomonas sp. LMG 12459 TaxID=1591131 RepID=UPI00126316BD|nr:hypothetical protein [Xanthomonas sp. LMG 12459]
MTILRRPTFEEATQAEDLAYELASKVTRLNGVGVIKTMFGYSIKINIYGGWVWGLPRRVNGVRVVYDYFVRPKSRALPSQSKSR